MGLPRVAAIRLPEAAATADLQEGGRPRAAAVTADLLRAAGSADLHQAAATAAAVAEDRASVPRAASLPRAVR